LKHPDVNGISFVGSSAVGRQLYAEVTAHGKRAQILGGAKNHILVHPDADYDLATDAIISSAFGSAGQRCLAGTVIVGIGQAYETMRKRLLAGASSITLGYALDGDPDMGPVISSRHLERIRGYIDAGVRDGAELLLDGRDVAVDAYPNGHWIGPTVFDKVGPEMSVGCEEIFGPVISLAHAESLQAAIDLTHKNNYGNMASIFTTSGKVAREFRYKIGISMLGVNIGVAAPMAFFPFGGARGSFFGDLKAQGSDAIAFYTDKRVVISRW
jgi:malonate-semialdehyde dehydrogenase (acetylating)/methylmalonate-semialdehyde dehydrogenase